MLQFQCHPLSPNDDSPQVQVT